MRFSRSIGFSISPIPMLLLLSILLLSPAINANASGSFASRSLQSSQFTGYSLVGPVPGNTHVLASLEIPLRNTASLFTRVMQVSDPNSPEYRRFITPGQARNLYYPTDVYNSVLKAIRSAGLSIEFTALDSTIVVEGTAEQISSAFHTNLDLYSDGSQSYYTSRGAPTFGGAYVVASNETGLLLKPAYETSVGGPSGNVTFTEGAFSARELQSVYNATSLYYSGDNGQGETIGLLDFYGSPTIASDLSVFDRTYGFQDPTFNIKPIGPYDPNLGANVGWAPEISIDVESAHAMAPGAAITMYVGNGALSLSAAIAKIVAEDNVTVLSQSFGFPEWYYSLTNYLGGPAYFVQNLLLVDQYYALGSAEGITFLASSGDGGGTGFSSGPGGSVEYPASSPFVTSVGGTQTYITQDSTGGISYRQVAYSDEGFVPNFLNEGGSGGGVSILEPKPWYQSQQATPATFPNGRLSPDVALQGGGSPGTLFVNSGTSMISGGTSESSPLFAGLLTLIAEHSKGNLGLVNPFLYHVGDDPLTYTKGFTPVTSGYTIPWTSSFGYNLATGWGAPNAGLLSQLVTSFSATPSLDMSGTIVNSSGLSQLDYLKGESLGVNVEISSAGRLVTSGSFAFSVQAIDGDKLTTSLSLDHTTGNWTGQVSIGQQDGIATVLVSGSSGGVSGSAMGNAFTGYLGTLAVTGSQYIASVDPWSWSSSNPLPLTAFVSDLNGNPSSEPAVHLRFEPYSILANNYTDFGNVTLNVVSPGVFSGLVGIDAPDGPFSFIMVNGTYNYTPAVKGIYLQTSYIFPEVAAAPGSVAPGQSITIIADPLAPANVYNVASLETGRTVGADVSAGANVTASLVNSNGKAVSNSTLVYQPCAQALRTCNGGAAGLNGYLHVPVNAAPGLYTVLLNASYSSYTLNYTLGGSFFGQVLVTSGPIVPKVSVVPSTLFEGENAQVVADIAYANGAEVRYGLFTAAVYPSQLQGSFTKVMHAEYATSSLARLTYDSQLDRWTGEITLPSPYDPGVLSTVTNGSLSYAGPYDIYVSGISYDGVPTTAVPKAQYGFFVQPYVQYSGRVQTPVGQTSGLAFTNSTILSPGALKGDVFLGNNTIAGGNDSISSSTIQGTLVVRDSALSLTGVTGGEVDAFNSTVVLEQTVLGSLHLVGSTVTLHNSQFGSVEPALPTINITSPEPNAAFNGSSFSATIKGNISSVKMYLDGELVGSFKANGSVYGLPMSPGSLVDGTHTINVVAGQSDGLSATASESFVTVSRLSAADSAINRLQKQLQNDESIINSFQSNDARYLLLIGLVSVAALVIGTVSALRGRKKLTH